MGSIGYNAIKMKLYADENTIKAIRLARKEFLRRFEMHILPKGFTKIRHYGFLQNHGKRERLKKIRESMKLSPLPEAIKIPVAIRMLEKYGKDIFNVHVAPVEGCK